MSMTDGYPFIFYKILIPPRLSGLGGCFSVITILRQRKDELFLLQNF